MKAIAILFLAVCTLPAFAGSVREDIQSISLEIRDLAPNSNASDRALRAAMNKLVEARDLIGDSSNDGGDSGRQSCIDFAYEAYSVTYGAGVTAANMATEACKKVKDKRVLQALYEGYSKTYGKGAVAMNYASSVKGVDGKGQLLSLLYDGYKATYGEGAVATNYAIESAKKLKRSATSCVRDLYPKYSATYGKGAVAMNYAVEKCK